MFTALLPFLPYVFQLIQAAPQIKAMVDQGITTQSLQAQLPHLVPLLEQIGAQMFTKASPAIHAVAAAAAAFDPNVTKWLQGSLNRLETPSPSLVVDGIYGPKTRAAVEVLQTQLGLKVDGWAGEITQGAIQLALSKLG